MKKFSLIVYMLVCAVILSGCIPLSIDLQRADQPVLLPTPDTENYEAVIGDGQPAVSYYVPLYFVSSDQQLVSVKRAITVEPGQSLIEQAMLALLRADGTAGATSPFPEGTRLIGIERCANAAVVDLSIEARNVENDQLFMRMREVIAATLLGLDGIEYVNVLIAGREEGILSLPAGAVSGANDDLTAAWTRVSAEAELLSRTGEAASAVRNVILYYPSRDGKSIAPVAGTVRVAGDDFIAPVIDALAGAPADLCLRSPIPAGAKILAAKPELTETADGRRMVKLSFDPSLISMLEKENLSEWQLYAALTYTLTGFVPGADGVIVMLGDGQLTRVERDGETISFTGGEMTRSAYPDALCRMGTVYMSAHTGGLMEVHRAMDPVGAVSPRALLQELFKGPAAWEEGAARVTPDGVSIDDILGIRIAGGEAIVNLSSNFYRCCQGLTAQQEKNLIYAVVNTLTGLPSVSSVRFQVEGEAVDYLVSAVYLRGSLLGNPGIVRKVE